MPENFSCTGVTKRPAAVFRRVRSSAQASARETSDRRSASERLSPGSVSRASRCLAPSSRGACRGMYERRRRRTRPRALSDASPPARLDRDPPARGPAFPSAAPPPVIRPLRTGGRGLGRRSQMLQGRTIVVVLPAYHAEATLERTYNEIPHDIVDLVLLVDDASDDGTVHRAHELGIETFAHVCSLGYGANQKTCYREALARAADIVVMLHPDYQYDPRLITAMVAMVASGVYDVVLGSRILGNTARSGGMPRYKYLANRLLTGFQNLMLGSKLSEFHTGYRALSRKVLEEVPLLAQLG